MGDILKRKHGITTPQLLTVADTRKKSARLKRNSSRQALNLISLNGKEANIIRLHKVMNGN